MATADWLVYSPEHKVLICKIHGFAVSALSSHLSRQHADLSCQVRNTIIAEYNILELDRPSNANFQYGPANPTAAIDGLTVHKGLACQDFQQCRFMSTSRKRLKVHCKEEHQWQVSRADPTHWSKVKLQTFFTVPGSAIHYFCVTTGPPQANAGEEVDSDMDAEEARGGGGGRQQQDSRLIAEIKEQWEHEQSRQEELQRVLAEGILRHETTTWLRRSGWTAHFNGRDLHRIHLCSRMPGPEDDVLQRLTANLDHLFFERCVDGLKSMPLMTRLLLASPHPHDAHSRP
ncbi:hypothetical protein BGZ61DRAFT_542703, partial [Ilyonectria robusta]|uniref:uncharacterized protein n=1 Tax=Ilyonectria robusta TaxID=1079257 RepID=UPI001E8D1DCB